MVARAVYIGGRWSSSRVCHIACIFLAGCLSGNVYGDEAKARIQYIETDQLSFSQAIERISKQTGYQIELVGEWSNAPVQVSLQGVSLEEGISRLIKQIGTANYVLVYDRDEKKLRIVNVRSGSSSEVLSGSDEDQARHEGTGSPTSGDDAGHVNLTGIKDDYHKQQEIQAGDAELLPSDVNGPEFTQAEFDVVKEMYGLLVESEGAGRYVMPPQGDDRGLTLSEFDDLRRGHRELHADDGPDTQLLPASADGPALTEGELEAAKRAYQRSLSGSGAAVIPLPFGQGGDITQDELEAIKSDYLKKHGSLAVDN